MISFIRSASLIDFVLLVCVEVFIESALTYFEPCAIAYEPDLPINKPKSAIFDTKSFPLLHLHGFFGGKSIVVAAVDFEWFFANALFHDYSPFPASADVSNMNVVDSTVFVSLLGDNIPLSIASWLGSSITTRPSRSAAASSRRRASGIVVPNNNDTL